MVQAPNAWQFDARGLAFWEGFLQAALLGFASYSDQERYSLAGCLRLAMGRKEQAFLSKFLDYPTLEVRPASIFQVLLIVLEHPSHC